MQRSSHLRVLSGLLAGAMLLYAGGALLVGGTQPADDAPPSDVLHSYATWAYDVTDDRLLVGHSDHVFTGLVVEIVDETVGMGEDFGDDFPSTTYVIQPIHNIKGHLSGAVRVVQHGGYDEANVLNLVEGDQLLMEGATELFVANVAGTHLLLGAPGFDHLSGLGAGGLDALVDRFTEAYRMEIDPFAER